MKTKNSVDLVHFNSFVSLTDPLHHIADPRSEHHANNYYSRSNAAESKIADEYLLNYSSVFGEFLLLI